MVTGHPGHFKHFKMEIVQETVAVTDNFCDVPMAQKQKLYYFIFCGG